MRCAFLPAAVLVASILTTACQAEDTKPAAEPKAEAKVDKTVAKPKQEIERFWITPEFLMMWSKDGPVHDLYVTRTTDGSQPILTNPTAVRLFSNDDQDYGAQLGGRLTFGMWVDDASKWGFELGGFALSEGDTDWSYRSHPGEYVGVPVFLTGTAPFSPPGETVLNVSIPGFQDGGVEVKSSSQLWGLQSSGLRNIKRDKDLSLDALFGFRYVDLEEKLDFSATSNGSGFGYYLISDHFDAHNRIYAANLGVKLSYTAWDRLLLSVEPSVALGANSQSLDIKGTTVIPTAFPQGAPAGGLFAVPPTYGDHNKTQFIVVPEVKVGLGCKITKNLSFNASYNLLYASDVVRPGEQINRRVNAGHLPAGTPISYSPTSLPNDPSLRFKTSDYWAQGVGVNFKIQF